MSGLVASVLNFSWSQNQTRLLTTKISSKLASSSTLSYTAYVPVGSLNEIVTINTATDTLGTALTIGHGQRAVALSPDDSTIYWTNLAGSFGYYNFQTGQNNQNVGFGGGSDPNAVAVSPNGVWVYVADYGGSKVVPFNAITKAVGATIGTSTGPNDVAITPDGKEVLATVPGSNAVDVISTATNTITNTINVTDPDAIAITPDGTTAWVVSYSGNEVFPIDLATLTVGQPIQVGTNPDAIAITPDGKKAFVGNTTSANVTPINLVTRQPLAPISMPSGVSSIAITPDGSTAFCVNASAGAVTPVTVATDAASQPISIGGSAYDIAIDPDQAPVAQISATVAPAGSSTTFSAAGSTVKFGQIVSYKWNFGDGTTLTTTVDQVSHTYQATGSYFVTVTETDSAGTSTKQIFTGHVISRNGSATAIGAISIVLPNATTPNWQALVVNKGSNSVTPINLSNFSVGTSVSVGTTPTSVAITPNAQQAFVTNSVSSTVSVLSISSSGLTLTKTINVSGNPVAVAISPNGAVAWVLTSQGSLIPIFTANDRIGTAITVGTSGGTPNSVAITPDGSLAYVSEASGSIIEVDLSLNIVVGAISVGGTPQALSITPNGLYVYVVDSAGNDIIPVTISDGVVDSAISTASSPVNVAISPDGSTAYVASSSTGDITPVNLIKETAETNISVTSALSDVAFAPNGALAIALNPTSNQAFEINTQSGSITTSVGVGNDPVAVAVTPDQPPNAVLIVTQGALGSPTTFSASSSTVVFGSITNYFWNFGDGTTELTTTPSVSHTYNAYGDYIASVTEVSSGGTSTTYVFGSTQAYLNGNQSAVARQSIDYIAPTYAYVTDSGSSELSVLNTQQATLLSNISTGSGSIPIDVAITPNNLYAQVVDSANSLMLPISTSTNVLQTPLSLGSVAKASDIVISPDGSFAYIAVGSPAEVIKVDLTSMTLAGSITLPAAPTAVALSSIGDILYVAIASQSEVVPVNLANDTLEAPITGLCSSGSSLAYDQANLTLYLGCSAANEVIPIDLQTNKALTPISVGTNPTSLVLNSDGSTLYVTNEASDSISEISTSTNTLTASVTLPTGDAPVAQALIPNTNLDYVVNQSSTPSVLVVDLSSSTVTSVINLPSSSVPTSIAVTSFAPEDFTGFVTNSGASSVTPFSTLTNTASAAFTVGKTPNSIVISADDSVGFVADQGSNLISVFNPNTASVTGSISLTAPPGQLAIAPNDSELYVCVPSLNEIVPISVANQLAGLPISLSFSPSAIAITPDNRYLLVAGGSTGELSIVNLQTNSIMTTITLGGTLSAISVLPNGLWGYIADSANGIVYPLSLSSFQVGTAITVGSTPSSMAVVPTSSEVYVLNVGSDTVSVINPETQSVITQYNLPAASNPSTINITPDGQTLYVSLSSLNGLYIINAATGSNTGVISVGSTPTSIAITPDQAPVATLTSTGVTLGAPITFSAIGSTVKFGSIVNYFWNFGDSSTLDTSSPVVTHVYTVAGGYTVTVTETDSAGTSTTVEFNGTEVEQNGSTSAIASTSLNVSASYHPINPVRVADTRSGSNEPYSGQTLGPGSSLNVQITNANKDGVPTSATAVVINVTAVDATTTSYLTVWPTGATRPLASNLNFTANSIVPNLVEIELGQSGQISIYNAFGDVNVLVDVEGYVGPATSPGEGLFNPVPPYRVCDTRTGPATNQCTGKTLKANSVLTIQVTGWPNSPTSPPSTGTVPNEPGVSAVVLNVTATDTTAWSYLTIWPAGSTRPVASNLNWTSGGTTVANRVIVPVNSSGQISIYNYAGSVDVAVDVNGWFTDASNPEATGTGFNGLVPYRICDTRLGSGVPPNQCNNYGTSAGTLSSNSTISVVVAGLGGVPTMSSTNAPQAVVLNVTATDTTGNGGYLTIWPDGTSRPISSDLNWNAGQTKANLVLVKTGSDGKVDVYNFTGSTDVIIDVVGWYS